MHSIPGYKLGKPIPVCFTKVIKTKYLSRISPISNNSIDDNSELTLGLKYVISPLVPMPSLYYKSCYLSIVQFVSLKISQLLSSISMYSPLNIYCPLSHVWSYSHDHFFLSVFVRSSITYYYLTFLSYVFLLDPFNYP